MVPHRFLRGLFLTSLLLALTSLGALAIIDEHLKSPASPLGIVSFELCAFRSTCSAITASWNAEAKNYAAMSLGLDYLFMMAYPAAISSGLWLLVKKESTLLRKPMTVMAHAIWFACIADAIENYHLFQMLMGQPIASHEWISTYSASAKFVCLVPALALCVLGAFRRVLKRRCLPGG